ncbi:hypothetical protein EYF80_008899 [Liparis tanakae]|uniref:Uncharacterized protein n=1 Tax=Liparis tanakae TaxID=230148 RepID=A0A4Z2ITN6_9TELE|nr:hypothetical protein EYF80_008899 [Liparis tanakae]
MASQSHGEDTDKRFDMKLDGSMTSTGTDESVGAAERDGGQSDCTLCGNVCAANAALLVEVTATEPQAFLNTAVFLTARWSLAMERDSEMSASIPK